MRRLIKFSLALVVLVIAGAMFAYFYLPVKRTGITSELMMLGDLNDDHRWDGRDQESLNELLANPFFTDKLTQWKADLNRNGAIDEEDLVFLEYIQSLSDPYLAEQKAAAEGLCFPRPRELFKYLPKYEYVQRPLFLLKHEIVHDSPFAFLADWEEGQDDSGFRTQLLHEIYDEALRFTFAYAIRKDALTEVEADYVNEKIRHCEALYSQHEYHEVLFELIGLVEDAETLTTRTQSGFIQQTLVFRDKLRALLVSETFQSFELGDVDAGELFNIIEDDLQSVLGISLDLKAIAPPRDFSDWENYQDRAEWQAFKSRTKRDAFKELVLFAQYDRRYLRAVSRTSPRHEDLRLHNHNLPMILLFREALTITGNDKKAAVGLLDEAIRIPLGWVKSIPRSKLPGSVALENFLLPGNMEDGSDKSRHWNVFGGLALYKSPEESLVLSLQREIMDLKDQNYSPVAMREFLRDTIANINGIYYVVSLDTHLLTDLRE